MWGRECLRRSSVLPLNLSDTAAINQDGSSLKFITDIAGRRCHIQDASDRGLWCIENYQGPQINITFRHLSQLKAHFLGGSYMRYFFHHLPGLHGCCPGAFQWGQGQLSSHSFLISLWDLIYYCFVVPCCAVFPWTLWKYIILFFFKSLQNIKISF